MYSFVLYMHSPSPQYVHSHFDIDKGRVILEFSKVQEHLWKVRFTFTFSLNEIYCWGTLVSLTLFFFLVALCVAVLQRDDCLTARLVRDKATHPRIAIYAGQSGSEGRFAGLARSLRLCPRRSADSEVEIGRIGWGVGIKEFAGFIDSAMDSLYRALWFDLPCWWGMDGREE